MDQESVAWGETEHKMWWLPRKMMQTMPARIARSGYETTRATATTCRYLSPWGDANPVLLPNVRYRDLVMQGFVAATGGAAAFAEPVLELVADEIGTAVGDIVLDLAVDAGVNATNQAYELAIDEAVDSAIPPDSKLLLTMAVKTLRITLKYKHTMANAALGYFRSSNHEQKSLLSTMKDFISIEKGWFSPYLFASHRRPNIPRAAQPDFIFCHGPFLGAWHSSAALTLALMVPRGDYLIAQRLLRESTRAITLCDRPGPEAPPSATALRRMVVVVVGLRPYRMGLWTSSERPGESVLEYALLDGCPALVLPLLRGRPLVAWHALTLEQLQKLRVEGGIAGARFRAVADSLFAYVSWCVDWERVIPGIKLEGGEIIDGDMISKRKRAVRRAVETLLAGAVQSDCPEVRSKVDSDRAGIAFFRMP